MAEREKIVDSNTAKDLIKGTFNFPFEESRFRNFAINLLNTLDEEKSFGYISGKYIKDKFKPHITKYRRLGTYTDPNDAKIDVLVVQIKNEWALERSRSTLRNFTADYLSNRDSKDAALVAYFSADPEDWRFSYIRMEYKLGTNVSGKVTVRKDITPAKRFSFLVGKNEPNHTAQAQLLPILENDRHNPTLGSLEAAFSVDAVSKQFYLDYRDLFERINRELDSIVNVDSKIAKEFRSKSIDTANFSKKLMGQIIFLYFLQKKGWLGVGKDGKGNFKNWGSGPKNFLHRLFKKEFVDYSNFFNDILEPLFYEALASEHNNDYYSPLDCKIPFLNGGLFEPLKDYNWSETDIRIDNQLMADVFTTFDQYNFTVREDEPLEKEVAIDPEMLGKVFENLLPENIRKGKGAYYTPRTIVHYMCQESLINYLDTEVNKQPESFQELGQKQLDVLGNNPVRNQLKLQVENRGRTLVPKADIETLIREGDTILELEIAIHEVGTKYPSVLMDSIKDNAQTIDDALSNIKVCDPAIGSGAFPVGMLNEIVKARKVLELYLEKEETTYTLKRHCIQESIYGVDLDPGAIDIAKLRLWLSLVVDENDYSHIQALPNLDYKIMQGNSLIEEFHGISLDIGKKSEMSLFAGGTDLDALIDDLHRKQENFFNAEHPNEKKKKRYDVEAAIYNIFHHELKKKREVSPQETQKIESELKEMTHGNKVRNFFPWKLYFADVFRNNGGFDVMIANPPYIQLQKSLDDGSSIKYGDIYENCNFKTFKRSGDIYGLFYELGINVLKDRGHLVYITSSKWMRSGYGDVLRGYFSNFNPKILLDFPRLNVFDSATVDVNILVIEKNKNQNKLQATHFRNDFQKDTSVSSYLINRHVMMHELSSETWFIGSRTEVALKKKIEDSGITLNEWDININRGVITGYNAAFILDETKRSELIAQDPKSEELINPILRGRDVKRYGYEFAGQYLIVAKYGSYKYLSKRYPAIYKHLKTHEVKLKKRGQCRYSSGYKVNVNSDYPGQHHWLELDNNLKDSYLNQFALEKVVWIELADDGRFAFVAPGVYTEATTFLMTSETPKYLLGVLNSKLVNWYFDKICAKSGVGTNRWKKAYVVKIPIVKITRETVSVASELERIVDNILITKEANLNAATTAFEAEIDQLVYALYGLSEDEIAIIEASLNTK
jgi:hypothetical protein